MISRRGLLIHGGGWVSGDKSHYDLSSFIKGRINVVNINYRLANGTSVCCLEIISDCPVEEFKNMIFYALSNSRKNVPTPKHDEWNDWQKERIKKLKEKSYTNLYKTSTYCGVRLGENIITPYPGMFNPPAKPPNHSRRRRYCSPWISERTRIRDCLRRNESSEEFIKGAARYYSDNLFQIRSNKIFIY